LSRKDIMTTK